MKIFEFHYFIFLLIIFTSACSDLENGKYNNNPCKANSTSILKSWSPEGSSSYPKNFCEKCDDYDSAKVDCRVYNLSLSFQYPELGINPDSLAFIIAKTFWRQHENKNVDTLNLTIESNFSLSEKYPNEIFATNNLIKENKNLRQDAIVNITTSYCLVKNIYNETFSDIRKYSNSIIKNQLFGKRYSGHFVGNVMIVNIDVDVLSRNIFSESFKVKNNFKRKQIENNIDDFELKYNVLKPNSEYCSKQSIEIRFFLNDREK